MPFLDHPQPTNVSSLGLFNHSLLMVYFIIIGFSLTSLIILLFLSNTKKFKKSGKKSVAREYHNFLRNYTVNKHLLTKLNLIMLSYLLFQEINLVLIQVIKKLNKFIYFN